MLRRSPMALVAVLLTVILAACGSSQGSSPSSPAATQAAAPASHRIVSLSPPATESLFAIGAGDQVVAVDDQSNYPAEAPHTKLSSYQPNVEAVAEYDPDLVVISFDPGDVVDGLKKLHIPVLMQAAPTDLEGAYAQIEELGEATGHAAEARQVVSDMRSRIAGVVDAKPGLGLSVYHEISPDYYSATSKTFIGSVYTLLGARNIADAAGGKAPDYPQLSAEYVVDSDPDVIVLSDTKCCNQSAKTVGSRPGWDELTAVQSGNVVPVDDDIASRWGPRIVDFVAAVGQAFERASGT
ncbi:MAG TPA: ABC transporter substrate-binding protein [Gaiellaceae bacterium]|nr:ABC transporter substrate-binding protein [Gaiellaceae bacterium]